MTMTVTTVWESICHANHAAIHQAAVAANCVRRGVYLPPGGRKYGVTSTRVLQSRFAALSEKPWDGTYDHLWNFRMPADGWHRVSKKIAEQNRRRCESIFEMLQTATVNSRITKLAVSAEGVLYGVFMLQPGNHLDMGQWIEVTQDAVKWQQRSPAHCRFVAPADGVFMSIFERLSHWCAM